MKFSYFLAFFFIPFVALCQVNSDQHYKIYSTKNQKIASVDDIINDLDHADVLFFGEEHNDSTCHVLEYLLFKKLAEKHPDKAALCMEMFETDCQNVPRSLFDCRRLWRTFGR